MEKVLLEYGVAGLAIGGLSLAVKTLYSDNKALRDQMFQAIIEQTRADDSKFQTLNEAIRLLQSIREGKGS